MAENISIPAVGGQFNEQWAKGSDGDFYKKNQNGQWEKYASNGSGSLKTKTVYLTPEQIRNSYDTPVTLIPAVPGKIVLLWGAGYGSAGGSVPYSGDIKNLNIKYSGIEGVFMSVGLDSFLGGKFERIVPKQEQIFPETAVVAKAESSLSEGDYGVYIHLLYEEVGE